MDWADRNAHHRTIWIIDIRAITTWKRVSDRILHCWGFHGYIYLNMPYLFLLLLDIVACNKWAFPPEIIMVHWLSTQKFFIRYLYPQVLVNHLWWTKCFNIDAWQAQMRFFPWTSYTKRDPVLKFTLPKVYNWSFDT